MTMATIWFCLVALMLAVYVVLDGFDLGAGALHGLVARSEEERDLVVRAVGPLWDGNEVWLVAAGGTLYFAFPALYAASFSGFYLPLTMVLWLLVLRGAALEFRGHLRHPAWTPFWDVVFAGASLLLALFLGVALGNVVRGVPLNAEGWFFEPLWTDWRVVGEIGILDWYTLLVGLLAVCALSMHGGLWLGLKTKGSLRRRARSWAGRAWWATLGLTFGVTAATWVVQPLVPAGLSARPWGWVLPGAALAGLALAGREIGSGTASGAGEATPADGAEDAGDRRAFAGSTVYLAAMLGSAALGLYPYVLPAVGDPALGLTAHEAAAPENGLRIGLAWWIPGVTLAGFYFVQLYRGFAGRVEQGETGHY